MSAFDLDQAGWTDRVNDARLTPAKVEDTPSLFAGGWRAAGEGVMRGGARVAQLLGMAASAPLVLAEKSLGTEGTLTDAYFHKLDDVVNDAVNFWTPDARTMGAGARAIGGLSEGALPLMATGGNPSLLIGTQGMGTATDLVREGVDAPTAVASGVTQSLATAAGFKVPILGRTGLQRVGTGVAGNVLFGAGAREAQHEILGRRGYEELASNYSPIDGEAIAVDALTGAVFGGLYHVSAPSEIAGTAAVSNAKHFQVDTAPGGIADVHASAAHQQAMQDGLEQAMRGEPVSVPAEVLEANFVKRPPREVPIPDEYRELDTNQAEEAAHQAEQAAADEGYSVAEGELTDEQRAQFDRLRPGAEPAAPEPGRTAAGGPPAANWRDATRIVGKVSADGGREPLTVYRGGEREVEQGHFTSAALGDKTGHPSSGLGVFFTTSEAEAARFGRVRPAQLDIRNPKLIKNEDLPGFGSAQDAATFSKKLAEQGYDGIIIKNKHLGPGAHDWIVAFRPDQVIHEAPAKASAPATVKPKPEPTPPAAKLSTGAPSQEGAGKATAAPTELAAAREHLANEDMQIPTGAIDEEGKPVTRSAREIMAEAEAGIAEAENDAKGIAAAVSCFLMRGPDAR